MFQSKQVKKNDVFFYLFLILLVVAIVGVTVFLIYDKNRTSHLDDLENTDSNDFDVSYFQFEEVSEAPVMDAFKEYAYNPIEIEYVNHRVVIDGLKDLNVQDKVNRTLSEMNLFVNNDGEEYCYVNFNVSNVLSITCDGGSKNINLVTGEEIKLEDIFQKDSDIQFILLNSIYENICAWGGCDPEYWYDQNEYNDVEDFVAEIFHNIQNKDYEILLYNTSFFLQMDLNVDFGVGYFYFSNFLDDVTIYDRFLTDENIYKEEPSEFCYPEDCSVEEYEDIYQMQDFIADKVYFNGTLNNFTNMGIFGKDYIKIEFDDEVIADAFQYVIDLYDLDQSNHYQYVNLTGAIYNTDFDYARLEVAIEVTELDYDDFKRRLFNEIDRIDPISNKEIIDVRIIIDEDGNVLKLLDDPNEIFVNFDQVLESYIEEDYNQNGDDSPFISYGNICYFVDDYDACLANLDFHDLVIGASYSIDLENRQIYMYYSDGDGIMSYAYISTFLPFELFQLKTT